MAALASIRSAIELHPMTPTDQKRNSVDLRIVSVRVQGPLDESHWVRTKNYDRFFSRDDFRKRKRSAASMRAKC